MDITLAKRLSLHFLISFFTKQIKKQVSQLKEQFGEKAIPGLAILTVGNQKDSLLYTKNKVTVGLLLFFAAKRLSFPMQCYLIAIIKIVRPKTGVWFRYITE